MPTRHKTKEAVDARYPSEAADRFMVRLPDGLRKELKAIAKANGRTMNAEVVARLEASFAPVERVVADPNTPDAARILRNALAQFSHAMADMIAAGRPLPEVHKFIEGSIKLGEAGG